ncbi:DUF6944 family repetitive protein [Paenibacillus sp. SAF-054]|uniref:DUF6944 family repetitive protein n=1 Tax=unclassified Paenibacillus TaxID=185978 RepID=UPI003F8211C4
MPAKPLTKQEELAAFAWLQALGTNLAALGQTKLLSKRRKQRAEGRRLAILGNALQSIANAEQAKLTQEMGITAVNKEANSLSVTGNLLQSIGNALQVIAGGIHSRSDE